MSPDTFMPAAGSPPHTRGTLGKLQADVIKDGITPAYAGNTDVFQASL